MTINFHPKHVKSDAEITAANRYRHVVNLSKSLESTFLAEDQTGADYHDEVDVVAGRFSDVEQNSHHGFVHRSGGLDVEGHLSGGRYHLERNEEASHIRYTEPGLDKSRVETFQLEADGTVRYQIDEFSELEFPRDELRFRPGKVESPSAVVAKERYDYIQNTIDAAGASAMEYDQRQEDLNRGQNEVALVGVSLRPEEFSNRLPREDFLAGEVAEAYSSRNWVEISQGSPRDYGYFDRAPEKSFYSPVPQTAPEVLGYYGTDRGADMTLDWMIPTAESRPYPSQASFNLRREDDNSSGELLLRLDTPIKPRNQTFSREESLAFSTEASGEIVVKMQVGYEYSELDQSVWFTDTNPLASKDS